MQSCPPLLCHARPRLETLPGRRDSFSFLNALCIALGLIVLLSVVSVALYHLQDSYKLDVGSGVFLALAQECRQGQLYPDVRTGDQFGGTRYMPLPFVVHAGMSTLTGEYLLSGKSLALAFALVLAWQVYRACVSLGSPAGVAFALASLVLASGSGLLAATTIRGDLLPVVCQLAALRAATGKGATAREQFGLAGICCTLAVLAKLTAAWAGLAILLYGFKRDPRCALRFLAAWLGSLALGLGLFHLASAGRMFDNLVAFSTAGLEGPISLVRGPYRMLEFMGKGGSGTHCLFPLAVLAGWLAWQQGRWTIYHTSWLGSLAILLVVFADLGAVSNHLLDLVVLSVIILAGSWPATASEHGRSLRLAITLALAWCLATCWAHGLAQETRSALTHQWGAEESPFPAKPLAGLVGDQETLLTDDPWVAVARGQRPVVLDAVSLARSVCLQPHRADPLVRRIGAREFAKIVLSSLPAQPSELDSEYFGRPIAEAIRIHYRVAAVSGAYTVLVPRLERDLVK